MDFAEKLAGAARTNKSLLCVGLDSDPSLMPEGLDILKFNEDIIKATADLVCAYKLNFAFYEVLGAQGMDILKQTVKAVPQHIPVIGDAKRNDIGNSAKYYAKAIFEYFGFDATTINPYFGFDSVKPFIDYREKGVFILCRTSNPGAVDFQSLICEFGACRHPLFEIVAVRAEEWNKAGNVGLVIGATYPEELKLIREKYPEMLLLIPGVGTQGGDLELTVRYGADAQGQKAIINSSRQVIYASKDKDFAQAARQAATSLRDQINACLTSKAK